MRSLILVDITAIFVLKQVQRSITLLNLIETIPAILHWLVGFTYMVSMIACLRMFQ